MDRSAEELIDQVNHIGAVGAKVETICVAAKTLETSFERDPCMERVVLIADWKRRLGTRIMTLNRCTPPT